MSGTATPNLPLANYADDVIGNSGGNTVRISAARLAAILSTLQGPSYGTIAQLRVDLSWPAGAIGSVFGGSEAGVYRKSGNAGAGSWTKIGDLPVSSLAAAQLAEKADLSVVSALAADLGSGRVWVLPTQAGTPSGDTIPDSVRVVLSFAGDALKIWRRGVSAPADGKETQSVQKDASGVWWYRKLDVAGIDKAIADLAADLAKGRVYATGAGSITTAAAPTGALRVLTSAGAETQVWGRMDAPDPAVETDTLKRDASGQWWRLHMDTRSIGYLSTGIRDAGILTTLHEDGSTGDQIRLKLPASMTAAGVTDLSTASTIEFTPTAANALSNPTLTIAGTTYGVRDPDGNDWPAGGFKAGRTYLLRRRNTMLRVIFDLNSQQVYDVADAAAQARVAAETAARTVALQPLQAQIIRRDVTGPGPGDGTGVTVVEDADGRPQLAVDAAGYLRARYDLSASSAAPGDNIIPLFLNPDGTTAFGVDARDGTFYPAPAASTAPASGPLFDFTAPNAPGDFILPVLLNPDGTTAFGIDTRDGSHYPAPPAAATTTPAPTGAAVAFVDPDNQGDAWNAIRTTDAGGEVIRYLSRQWRETWGYEKRGTVTLAQTPDPAVGVVSFGGGSSGVARPVSDGFPYHLVDETLAVVTSFQSAPAQAAAFLEGEYAARRGLPTVVAMGEVVGSTVEADALPGAARRTALVKRVAAAQALLVPWGKALFVDRIALSLLEGAPATPQATADAHYAAVAQGLRTEIAAAAKQVPLPVVVVSQSAGTRTDGTSPVILAEGNLDWAHWSLGLIVATPRYPFPLEAGTAATLTAESALLVSELEALAVGEKLAGRNWYGPTLAATATLSGAVISVPFTAMGGSLVIRDPANHGFSVNGVTNGAVIQSVAVSGSNVLITLSAVPAGALTVDYAFGRTGDRGDAYTANRGSLTDSWSQPSRMVPGRTLYRYARSGRIIVQ